MRRALVAVCAALAACSGTGGGSDGGSLDAAASLDARSPDDAAPDARPGDAATADADDIAADAAPSPADAAPDAGPADAGGWLVPAVEGHAVREGDVVSWYAGPQGGHHLFAGMGIDPELIRPLDAAERREIVHAYQLVRESDGALLASTMRTGGLTETSTAFVTSGVLLILQQFTPAEVSGPWLEYVVALSLPNLPPRTARVRIRTTCCR